MTSQRFVTGFAIVAALASVEQACAKNAYDWTAPVAAYVIDLFEPREFTYNGGKYRNQTFAYRLFVPRKVRPDIRYPLVVWASGYGQRGNDNTGQLMHLDHVFTDRDHPENYEFFMLAMQNPPEAEEWFAIPGEIRDDDITTVLVELIQQTGQEHPIDSDRIVVAGISAGGDACWELALRYPNMFAALAPMASSGVSGNLHRLSRIRHIPTWAFHCSRDPTTPVHGVRRVVEKLESLQGRVHLTEFDSKSHDCWTAAFRDYDLMEWLMSQGRGGAEGFEPGERPWRWWHYSVLPLVAVVLWMAYLSERHKRLVRST